MYCSSCGSQIKPELNYCSRCGTKVAKTDLETPKPADDDLSSMLGAIGVFGFVGYIFVALVLVKYSVPVNALVAISIFYLGALFGICRLILKQIAASSGKSAAPVSGFRNNFQTDGLNSANTAQLESPREPAAASVTDNTTKTLDEVLLKRN
ncbi:MAG TPA: hypothetical protein VGB00_03880 [Pyrinomonadaceae bacterium]